MTWLEYPWSSALRTLRAPCAPVARATMLPTFAQVVSQSPKAERDEAQDQLKALVKVFRSPERFVTAHPAGKDDRPQGTGSSR